MDVVKCSTWEEAFWDRIQAVRGLELAVLWKSFVVGALNVFLLNAIPTLVSVCTFTVYVLLGNQLDATTAVRVHEVLGVFSNLAGMASHCAPQFTALTLFNVLRLPLFQLPQLISLMTQTQVLTTAYLLAYLPFSCLLVLHVAIFVSIHVIMQSTSVVNGCGQCLWSTSVVNVCVISGVHAAVAGLFDGGGGRGRRALARCRTRYLDLIMPCVHRLFKCDHQAYSCVFHMARRRFGTGAQGHVHLGPRHCTEPARPRHRSAGRAARGCGRGHWCVF